MVQSTRGKRFRAECLGIKFSGPRSKDYSMLGSVLRTPSGMINIGFIQGV